MNNFQTKSLSDSEVNLGAKSDILRYEVRIAHFVPLSLSFSKTHTYFLSLSHTHTLFLRSFLYLCVYFILFFSFFFILSTFLAIAKSC